MFGFFKSVLRKMVEAPADEPEASVTVAEEEAEPSFEPSQPPVHYSPSPRGNGNGHHQNGGKSVQLSLQSILRDLPLELQPRVKRVDVGDLTINIPLEKVLSQLSRGAVKISFGELKQFAPELFDKAIDRDRVPVSLPLADILAQLNPALITRRRVQKQVEVPAEISSPFDRRSQAMIFSVGPVKADSPAAGAQFNAAPAPIMPGPSRENISTAATPAPPGAVPPASGLSLSARNAAPARISMAPIAPTPTPPPPPPVPPLMVGLTALADGWPESVRQEIVRLNLVDAKVGLPSEAVERALKQGRIAFTWKMLRSWIKPSPLPTVSAHDGAILELPLKVVAPIFLARQNEAAKSQHKVPIDENIPNLFFGFPQPEAGGAPGAAGLPKPVDTNYYVWEDSSDTVRVHESEVKRSSTPGTSFVSRYATPNEVVSRAASLDGVEGALIALPDGLMVASRLAPDLNGETLAAFLPQIFGKLTQCTKELRMGELNNLNFTVGNVPWKIFRVNAIFFAAFGRTGEPLPTSQLAALAAELDHKPK